MNSIVARAEALLYESKVFPQVRPVAEAWLDRAAWRYGLNGEGDLSDRDRCRVVEIAHDVRRAVWEATPVDLTDAQRALRNRNLQRA